MPTREWMLRSDQFAAENQRFYFDQESKGRDQMAAGAQSFVDNAMTYASMRHEMEISEAESASRLQTEEVKRATAWENLQWARELHTTDMAKAQRDVTMKQAELAIAQADEEMKRITEGETMKPMTFEETSNMIVNAGVVPTFVRGRVVGRLATPEERADAEAKWKQYQQDRMRYLYGARWGTGGMGGEDFMDPDTPLPDQGDPMKQLLKGAGGGGAPAQPAAPQVSEDKTKSTEAPKVDEIAWHWLESPLTKGIGNRGGFQQYPAFTRSVIERISDFLPGAKAKREAQGKTYNRAAAIEMYMEWYRNSMLFQADAAAAAKQGK